MNFHRFSPSSIKNSTSATMSEKSSSVTLIFGSFARITVMSLHVFSVALSPRPTSPPSAVGKLQFFFSSDHFNIHRTSGHLRLLLQHPLMSSSQSPVDAYSIQALVSLTFCRHISSKISFCDFSLQSFCQHQWTFVPSWALAVFCSSSSSSFRTFFPPIHFFVYRCFHCLSSHIECCFSVWGLCLQT